MKKPAIILGVLFTTILCLSIVQVFISNSLSTTGIELEKLQTNIAGLKKQNALLTQYVLKNASYTYVASVAAQIGFVPAKSAVGITAPLPLALNQ